MHAFASAMFYVAWAITGVVEDPLGNRIWVTPAWVN